MKIYIIRHGKVNMKWPKYCNSLQFDEACKRYDNSEIIPFICETIKISCNNIFISNLSRSLETARILFPKRKYNILENIKEVPLRSFVDCKNLCLPLWTWNIFGRLQWLFNSNRQEESYNMTRKRANNVISDLEKINRDSILITHGFFMKILVREFKEKGYIVNGHSFLGFANLQVICVEK